MKRRNHALGFLLAAAMAGFAPQALAASWVMNPDASTLSFTGTQTGSEFRGQFRRFETQIVLDPEDLSSASVRTVINTNSIASGSPDRDSDAHNSDWFHTSVFPEAVFTSNEVVHVKDNGYLAVGVLEIKGIEQAVELPFTLDIDGDAAVADGTLTLNRLDYNVGIGGEIEDDSFIGHQVIVTFHVEATRAE